MFSKIDTRNRKNLLYSQGTMPISNYCTRIGNQEKSEMRHFFNDDFFNNFPNLQNPLQKNLTDAITMEEQKGPMAHNIMGPREFSPLAGIGNFLSHITKAFSSIFRSKSPVPQYHDCIDDLPYYSDRDYPILGWQTANIGGQNKSGSTDGQSDVVDMNFECRAAAAHCEDKLFKVRQLLNSAVPRQPQKVSPRRRRRAFIEASSVEETFLDAFNEEDFISLPNDDVLEYVSPFLFHDLELWETDSAKIKTEYYVPYNIESRNGTVKTSPESKIETNSSIKVTKTALEINDFDIKNETRPEQTLPNVEDSVTVEDKSEPPKQLIDSKEKEIEASEENKAQKIEVEKEKCELVSSCEDKMNKLKSLLFRQSRRSADPILKLEKSHNKAKCPEKIHDKHFKNPNRVSGDKRKKQNLRKNIMEDMVYANEIDSDDLSGGEENLKKCNMSPLYSSSVDSIPSIHELEEPGKDYFNEVTGRFRKMSTTDSEDSFQIVFSETPRVRKASDCESEDSFIVFEDSPDSCYVSNEVFSDEDESNDESESEEESDSDSGQLSSSRLSPSLTRTVGDLTDDSLYDDKGYDEVDCSARICEEVPVGDLAKEVSTGLLLDEFRKKKKKNLPPKKVTFSSQPPKVHVMRVWTFAARQARAGHWEQLGRDRDRFKRRIADVEMAISWVLKPPHRSRVLFQRFMPWWNAQRRRELEEKKQREEEKEQREAEEERKKQILEKEREETNLDAESGSAEAVVVSNVESKDE